MTFVSKTSFRHTSGPGRHSRCLTSRQRFCFGSALTSVSLLLRSTKDKGDRGHNEVRFGKAQSWRGGNTSSVLQYLDMKGPCPEWNKAHPMGFERIIRRGLFKWTIDIHITFIGLVVDAMLLEIISAPMSFPIYCDLSHPARMHHVCQTWRN